MAEAYVARMPRSPFQMQSLRNPFERVLPAVVQMRDRVVAGVREVGTNITHRMQRTQVATIDSARRAPPVDVRRVQDAVQLDRARATIATATPQPSLRGVSETSGVYPEQGRREVIPQPHSAKKAIIHGIAEATKNSAPSMVVGAGARIVLGHALGLQALAVAAGVAGASRVTRETVRTVRFGGTYRTTTAHIMRHERDKNQEMQRANNPQSLFGRILKSREKFGHTFVGRRVNDVLHGGEKAIAEFAYGKRRHRRALMQYAHVDEQGRIMTDTNGRALCNADAILYELAQIPKERQEKYLYKLREHAIMARITHGTEADMFATRQLARQVYQVASSELAKKGHSKRQHHEEQKRYYRKDARVGAAINIPLQGALAVAKALPKTFATFFITDTFLKAIHVDTSARHSPLEGFENTRLGHLIENAIAPKSVISAEELNANVPNVIQAAVTEAKTATATAHGESAHSWTQGLAGSRSAHGAEGAPSVTVSHTIVNGREATGYSQVLSTKEPKSVAIPRPPSPARIVVEVDDKDANAVARAVVSGKDHLVTTQKTVTEIVHEQIAGKTSLTQDIVNKKLFPEMQNMTDPKLWFREVDSAQRMMERVLLPNTDKMGPGDIPKLQAYLQENPHATFRDMWFDNRDVFSDDLDKLSLGAEYNVALEHVVTQQEAQQVAISEAKNAKVELADRVGGGKPPGLAKYVASTISKPHTDTTPPPQSFTKSGVPIQKISVGQATSSSGSGVPVQQISINGSPAVTRDGIPVQTLGGPQAEARLPNGQIPVQKISIDMSTSGFPNSVHTQVISIPGQSVVGEAHTSSGIPIQRISIDTAHTPTQSNGIHTQTISVPQRPGSIPVQRISIDSPLAPQAISEYSPEQTGAYVIPFYEHWNGQNGDVNVTGVTATYDPRFGLNEHSTVNWDNIIFKRDTITDPNLSANDMLCAPGPNGSTFCGDHSGTNEIGFLPEEWMRRHYQVADPIDQLISNSFTSREQIQIMADTEAREGYTREFTIQGKKAVYKLVETRFIDNDEEALFTGSPTMIAMSENGALISHFCTHGSLRAWDAFDSVYRNLQETNGYIPVEVQEAYEIMHRQASEAEIDRAASIVKDFLKKNNFPDAYATFIKWYKLAITADEQRQGALVQKWMPVTGQ